MYQIEFLIKNKWIKSHFTEGNYQKEKKQKQNITSDCVVVQAVPCSLYFSIFNPVSLMSMYWFKMGKRIIFKKDWQSH